MTTAAAEHDSYNIGQRCWIVDESEVYISATITAREAIDDARVKLCLGLENGSEVVVETTKVSLETGNASLPALRNPAILEQVQDLTELSYLNVPSVLHAVRTRYQQREIYTYSGIVLVAVNPFEKVPIYDQTWVQQYSGKAKALSDLDPHLYAIAEDAFRCMLREGRNQTIIVSGESGAGKTVSARYIMRYFATVDNPDQPKRKRGPGQKSEGMSRTEEQILATNPIMEAFGNAKTTRNDNSSRFGKYIEILFDRTANIIGARMRTYLLERSRVVYQALTERNYHIFYQLIAGASAERRQELSLSDLAQFRYLNQGGEPVIANVDDALEFSRTQDALAMVGIDNELQNQMWRVLAAILHLGNLDIGATRDAAVVDREQPALKTICTLLGLDGANFVKWLGKRQMKTRNERIETPRSQREALTVRDSIARFLYSNLFDWLVRIINRSLCDDRITTQIKSFIGVLDIYGFEHFQKNSFEQFCINYANEKLQQEFNSHVFKLEQEEYVTEGIPWQMIDFSDNAPCIALIEGKIGLLSLLDEQARLPAGSDAAFQQRLAEIEKSSDVLTIPKLRKSAFTIRHYALPVTYDSDGFLDKNKDTVPDEVAEVLEKSSSAFVLELLNHTDPDLSGTNGGPKRGPAGSRKPTLGSVFKSSLIRLMDTIDQTNAHYIRCIKPNEQKEAWTFEPRMVMQQLTACGVLETIRISAAGYPSRSTFQGFVERYFCLVRSSVWASGDLQVLAGAILQAAFGPTTSADPQRYQIGATKIFFKPGVVAQLETKRTLRLNTCATTIQAMIRTWLTRVRRTHMTRSSLLAQRLSRGIAARQRLQTLKQKSSLALKLQCVCRGRSSRSSAMLHRSHRAATQIQRVYRGYRHAKKWRAIISAVSSVQRMWLASKARRELQALRQERASVQHFQEKNAGLANKIMEQSRLIAGHEATIADLQATLSTSRAAHDRTQDRHDSLRDAAAVAKQELEQSLALNRELQKRIDALLLDAQTSQDAASRHALELNAVRGELERETAAREAEVAASSEQKALRMSLEQEIGEVRAELHRLRVNGHQPDGITSAKSQDDTERAAQVSTNSPRTPPRARLRRSLIAPQSDRSLRAEVFDPRRASVATTRTNIERTVSGASFGRHEPNLEQQIMNILEDDDLLNNEIMYGMIQSLKMPQPSLQTPPSIDDVLFPARLVNLIVSEMWKWGYIKESERLLANVMQAIQQQVITYEGEEIVNPGAFWLSNVHEMLSFVWMAEGDILRDNAGMDDVQWQEYDRLISLVRHDLESLEYNIYHTWMKELKKRVHKLVVPALIESQALPGFMTTESSRFFNKLLPSTSPTISMDDLLNVFNKIFKALKSFYIEESVITQAMTELLRLVGVVAFNDLLMRRNFLSWKRGLQINYNVTRIEEWCKTHNMPELILQLEHLTQATKLLQLKKVTVADIDILYDICWCLSNRQIHKLINQYYPADYESPISPEILKAVAARVTQEETTDILLDASALEEIGTYDIAAPRQILELRTPYVPSYLSLIRTKLLLKLLEEDAHVQTELAASQSAPSATQEPGQVVE